MVYVLNTPVLPNYGEYRFTRISVKEAKDLLNGGFVSAVGHKATAEILSSILGINIPENRVAISLEKGDIAVVFKLGVRLPEGKILSAEELRELNFELGKLERLA
jgi:hypothetical protein